MELPRPLDPTAAAAWRQICLDQQLPRARFPAGVAVPALIVFWCLVLIAGLSIVVMGGSGQPSVPGAVLDSQSQLVSGVADTLEVSVRAAVSELAAGAARADTDPPAAAAALVAAGSRFHGATVLAQDRAVVTAAGDPIPPDVADRAARRPVALPGAAATTVVVTTPLRDGRLLAALADLDLRPLRLNTEGRQSVFLRGPGGAVHELQGSPVDKAVTDLVRRAVAAADNRAVSTVGGQVANAGGPASPVASAAPVGNTGLHVVSVTTAAHEAAGPRGRGFEPAVSLGLLAVALLTLLYASLVRPVLRVLTQARDMACGGMPRRFARPLMSEAARLWDALATIATRKPPVPGRTVPAVAIVAACAVALGGWCATVATVYSGDARTIPTQVRVDARNDVEGAAASLRDALRRGLSRLESVAPANGAPAAPAGPGAAPAGPAAADPDPADLRGPLDAMVSDGDMRSAYVVDPSGRPVFVVGEEPNRVTAPPPPGSGVRLDRVTGPVPVVYAHRQVSGRYTMIAEYGVRYLTGLLRRADGRVRVLDERMRAIFDTGGYVPFRVPSGTPLRQAAADAFDTGAVATVAAVGARPDPASGTRIGDIRGSRMLIASAVIGGETLPGLHWAVLGEQPVGALRLADNDLNRGTWLVAFLALCVAVLLFFWYRLVVIRPLRLMAAAAERLVDGELRTTVTPVRHDEIGAIAVCLDIIRQTMADGMNRLAGAVRLKGALSEPTRVMPTVRLRRPDGRGSRRAPRIPRQRGRDGWR